MRGSAPLAFLAILAPAFAQGQLGLAARAGLAMPVGDAYEDRRTGVRTGMSSLWSTAYPLQLEVLYRLPPGFVAGAYLSYAAVDVGGDLRANCGAEGFSCSARTVRIGIEGTHRLREVRRSLFPWLGAGIGWEWTRFDVRARRTGFEARFGGVELLGQAGVEYEAGARLAMGPYAAASFGTYCSVDSKAAGFPTQSEQIHGTLHAWVSVGLRGRYEP